MSLDIFLRSLTPDKADYLRNHLDESETFILGPRDVPDKPGPRIFSAIWAKEGDWETLRSLPSVEGWFLPEPEDLVNLNRSQDLLIYLMTGTSPYDAIPNGEEKPAHFLHQEYIDQFYLYQETGDGEPTAFLYPNEVVQQIAAFLESTPFEKLMERYDEAKLTEMGLNYRAPDDDVERYKGWIRGNYDALTSFFNRAANDGKEVLMVFIE